MTVSAFFSQHGSSLIQATSTALDYYNTYTQSKILETQGKLNETLGQIEADSLRRNATLEMNKGVRAGEIEKYKTRATMSDATAAMAAGGGVVDPEMLARIKQRGDYNTMSAVYDAQTNASTMRQQATMVEIQSKFGRSQTDARATDMRQGAFTTALSAWPRSTSQKLDTPSNRPANYDWRTVAKKGKAQGRGGYS